ncbi:MAG TPA: tetratricopeptide repeat protein [Desulfuromonadales bacterium]|nr:tetratricopeptide repeat protein [Desulfuromonadales bacterium]
MNVAMPHGTTHGWGIAGNYLTAEIAKLPLIPEVTLHCVAGHHFAACDEERWNRFNIGYCFFEHEILAYHFIPEAAKRWDHIVAGSSWCEHHLRIAGMERTSTILQGVDPTLFHSVPPRQDDGRFIVFSGGKFEFRKGHDLVMAAMKIFMARHPDVWLACAWHNGWPNSIKTMEQSRYIDFQYRDLPYDQLYSDLLSAHSIDSARIILYPLMENHMMKSAYANSDVGLFPNRCEGGNNMVMCEYMACGRPVIASTMTGHRDVVAPEYVLCLESYEPVMARMGAEITGVWFEPNLEEMVALLEQAYCDRQMLRSVGEVAGLAMMRLSWAEAARSFHTLACQLAQPHGTVTVSPVPENPEFLFADGRFAEAEKGFRAMLEKAPLDPELYNSLATTLDRLGRYGEAVWYYEKALALRPRFFIARFNLANTLKRLEDGSGAIDHLEQVVAAEPEFVAAWQNLALCCFDGGNVQRATECLERAVILEPTCTKSKIDLGDMLIELGRYQDAVNCFDEALVSIPDNAGVLNSKGIALQELDDLDGAEVCYRRILEDDPDNTLALNNLGTILRSNALPLEAIDCFDRALKTAPGDGQLIFNRSLARLALGDFESGWPDYENRFTKAEPVMLNHLNLPRWDGGPLRGKCLLVQSEQGYGDTLLFARYLPLLYRFGGSVLFEVQDRSIKSAVDRIDPAVTVIARGEQLPAVDCQVPLLSLPLLFKTDFSTIPFPGGYLLPDPDRKNAWEQYLGSSHGRKKVGLVWGGRKPRLNANRSMRLHDLRPILQVEGLRFISLQVGEDAAQVSEFGGHVEDVMHKVSSFADTAALVATLDLVISVDTAVAHLAGALGVNTWVLLKYAPDWRWFLERGDNPWYASMRLFRQQETGEWGVPVTRISEALKTQLKKD